MESPLNKLRKVAPELAYAPLYGATSVAKATTYEELLQLLE